MNTTTLNMTTLDGGVIIKKGGGGGATINNQDKVVDITENGTTEVVADDGYTGLGKVTINTEVEGAKPKWTGHADAEGLKAIGWTDEDIAYYQENGVNWNEEDDEWHKVTDDNKALYGVLTAKNISTYRDRIVYLPKIDTSNVANMSQTFFNCHSLTAIPLLNTSSVTDMIQMFNYCYSLTHANLKNVKLTYGLNDSPLLSKSSLLYIINNETATSARTIKLAVYAYNKWATDPDIVAALANHPNISISK